MLSDEEEENIVWTYFAVQNSTTEGAYFAIPILTFSAMKHPKVRGVLCCDLSNLRGGVTNIRDVIQISQIPVQLIAFQSDN